MKYFPLMLLCLFCTACAPKVQNFCPALSGPVLTERELIAVDGTHLPLRQWLPADRPSAVIVALHGFNDYSHSFEMPGSYLSAHGVALISYDQRGFGDGPGFGIWGGENNLVRDAVAMVRATEKRYPGTPVYLLGESMGGAIAVIAAAQPDFPAIDGLILSAPAVWGGETLNPLFRASVWLIAHTWPQKKVTGAGLQIQASDNIPMLIALGRDPKVIKATRVDAIYGLVEVMDDSYRLLPNITQPTLLLYGAHDQVIPGEPIVKSVRKLGHITTAVYYPAGYHMLLRDKERALPTEDILAWIRNPDAVPPSGDNITAPALEKAVKDNKK